MVRFLVLLLLLCVASFAESQEAVYYRALLAEESGDVATSVSLFEKACAMDGEYTEEVCDIVKQYHEALGKSESPWSYRLSLGATFYGLHYREFQSGKDVNESGGNASSSLSFYLEYSTANWTHSFGANFQADWFIDNDDMPALDTNDWTIAPGIEYLLMGDFLMLDLGMDFNVASEENLKLDFYGFAEVDLFRFGKQRVGLSLFGFYREDGPFSLALYATWHRYEKYGFSGNVSLGLKMDADSLLDYQSQAGDSVAWNSTFADSVWGSWPSYEGYKNYDYTNWTGYYDYTDWMTNYDYSEWMNEDFMVYSPVTYRWCRWLGPSLKSSFSYGFRNGISIEAKLNAFYGILLDCASQEYEELRKFSGSYGLVLNWKLGPVVFLLGFEQLYQHYSSPESLAWLYPENTLLSEIKIGLKFDI